MSPSLPYPGPFGTAPTPGNGNSSLFAAPNVTLPSGDAGSAGTSDGTGTGTDDAVGSASGGPLATTGSDAPILATISVLLISIGGVLMVASRREDADLS